MSSCSQSLQPGAPGYGPTGRGAFWRGVVQGLPFALGILPFGLLYGVTAAGEGMSLAQIMAMSVMVLGGTAQFAALAVMQADGAVWAVLATALAVNLRLMMYSASLAPWLGQASLWQRILASYFIVDQSYILGIAESERRPWIGVRDRVLHFTGAVVPVCLPWYATTWIGAALGRAIPPEVALERIVPVCFIAVVAPLMRTRAHLAAAAVSAAVALALSFLPYNLWLLGAALAAMATGVQVESRAARRAAR
jgi:predicted branched-subunit amino acid permease